MHYFIYYLNNWNNYMIGNNIDVTLVYDTTEGKKRLTLIMIVAVKLYDLIWLSL